MDNAVDPIFTRPHLDPVAVSAARRVRDTYQAMAEGTGEFAGTEIDDPAEDILRVPYYQEATPALGIMLAFMFPSRTYGNEDVDPRISFDSPVGDLCVCILDPRPGSDPDLYAQSIISPQQWEAIGVDAIDEYHFEFIDKSQSITQAIQKLLDAGLDYLRESPDPCDPCLFRERLGSAIPTLETPNPPSMPPPP